MKPTDPRALGAAQYLTLAEIKELAAALPRKAAAAVVRAIDRADARGAGCDDCKAARQVARKVVVHFAR